MDLSTNRTCGYPTAYPQDVSWALSCRLQTLFVAAQINHHPRQQVEPRRDAVQLCVFILGVDIAADDTEAIQRGRLGEACIVRIGCAAGIFQRKLAPALPALRCRD
jgi:hypothetical protein